MYTTPPPPIPLPKAQVFFICFALRSEVFKIQGCQKSEMPRMTSEWFWTFICQTCSVYAEYLPPEVKCLSVWLYDQAFLRYKFIENWKRTKWPQTDLEHIAVKSSLHILIWILDSGVQRSLCFALRWLLFEIIADFGLPICYNVEREIPEKNLYSSETQKSKTV